MCLYVSSSAYDIPRLLSLLVLACLATKDEMDIPRKFEVSTPAFLYRPSAATRFPELWC